MLVEVKVKVARIIDSKTRKRVETYVVSNCDLFVEAEQKVMETLAAEQSSHLIESFQIQSLRISPIMEVCVQYTGEIAFIATLKDYFHADDGTEKILKYKVLLWADSHADALSRIQELAREGYDMHIEGIKEVEYKYIAEDE